MGLDKRQIERYSRQLILPQLGVAGQKRLLGASVLVIGAGGLGSPAAFYLAAAGVGRIGILDDDTVSLDNLHRQIIHTTDRIGTPKAASAARSLKALNPEIDVVAIGQRLQAENALALLAGYDLILDGSDNFATRYLVNDACVLLGKPFIYGGVVGFSGQVLVARPGQSACLRCVFPEPPAAAAADSCRQAGVIGAAAGVIGSFMALEAVKLLAAIGVPLQDRMLVFDAQAARMREVAVRRDTRCAVCGEAPTIARLTMEEEPVCAGTPTEESWPGNK